jgi:hypothetical protein
MARRETGARRRMTALVAVIGLVAGTLLVSIMAGSALASGPDPLVTIDAGIPDGSMGWFVHSPVSGTVTADDTGTGNNNITSIDCTSSLNGGAPVALSLSGVVTGSPTASGTFSVSGQGTTSISCTASDDSPNTSDATLQEVKIDTVIPAVTTNSPGTTCSPTPGAGLAGWCRGTQNMGFKVTDATSGNASPCAAAGGVQCVFTRSSTTNGFALAVFSGSVCDVAGNCSVDAVFLNSKIDSSPPLSKPKLVGSKKVFLSEVRSASPGASDVPLDGITSGINAPLTTCPAVSTSTVGKHTISCTATDNAGNTTPGVLKYTVKYIFAIVTPAPNDPFVAGSSIPLVVTLSQAGGSPISDAEALAIVGGCRGKVKFAGNTGCLTYDTGLDQFQLSVGTWAALAGTTQKITVTVKATDGSTVGTGKVNVNIT